MPIQLLYYRQNSNSYSPTYRTTTQTQEIK
jgi:hypothetical protein